MISYVKGTLERRAESYIVIETGGIGYRIFVSPATLAKLPQTGAEAKVYTNVKVNAYYAEGFGKYYIVSEDEYKAIQEYQNQTGIQVLYPLVSVNERPTLEKNKYDANIYYQVENLKATTVRPKLDPSGNVIPNYWAYAVGSEKTYIIADYNSLRIEGEGGVSIDGENYHYVYGRLLTDGIEVRVFRYAYSEYLKQAETNS